MSPKKFIPVIDEVMAEVRNDFRPDNFLKDAIPSPKELFDDILPPPPHELLREIIIGEKKKGI